MLHVCLSHCFTNVFKAIREAFSSSWFKSLVEKYPSASEESQFRPKPRDQRAHPDTYPLRFDEERRTLDFHAVLFTCVRNP
jgi:hypothetical protein